MSKLWKLDPDTVAEEFVEALVIEKRQICLLWGPFGSSKSVTACHAVYLLSLLQPRVNGKRRSKWAFVRNTNDQLKQTTLATWLEWFPENEFRRYLVGEKRYEWREGDLEIDILFLPLDSPEDVRKLLSLELTGCFLNESREIEKSIWDGVDGRVGRFPPAADVAQVLEWGPDRPTKAGRYYRRENGAVPTEVYVRGGRKGVPLSSSRPLDEGEGVEWAVAPWSGIIADSNPSSTDDFLWKQFFEKAVEDEAVGWKYSGFRQPPGLVRVGPGKWDTNPAAENLRNLKPGYYLNLAAGKSENWVRMYCCGEAVVLSDGKPVFPQFDAAWHVCDFEFDPRLEVYAGWDFGIGGVACLLGQISARGQLRIFDEYTEEDMSTYQFAKDLVKPGIARWKGARWAMAWSDPHGAARGDSDAGTSLKMVNDAYDERQVGLPFKTYPSPDASNSLGPRLEAVNWFLSGTVPRTTVDQPTAPRMIVHPRCSMFIAAMAGRYEYRRVQTSEQRYTEIPNKNRWSHIVDAGQYLCLGLMTHLEWGQKSEDDEPVKRGYARVHRGSSGY